MSNWSGFTLTNKGAALQAKINAGITTLKFTKLGIGSGSTTGSIQGLTNLVNKVQDLGISSITTKDNIVIVKSVLTNKGVSAAYQMKEMGLFATDPNEGEILFAYMTDYTPDIMPADGSATVVSQEFMLNLTFSNTGNVSATIDTEGFITWSYVINYEKDRGLVDNSDSNIPTTSWVQQRFGRLADGVPSDLDTLKKIAMALGDKAPINNPTFTGTVNGPTPDPSANGTEVITAAWVLERIGALATGKITGDVSNPSAWWVKIPCQGFNLLIQGGLVFYRRNKKIKFPVAFKSRCLGVIPFDKSDIGDNINWIYGTGSYTTTDFFCLAERIDGTYPDDCNCQYIAIGV